MKAVMSLVYLVLNYSSFDYPKQYNRIHANVLFLCISIGFLTFTGATEIEQCCEEGYEGKEIGSDLFFKATLQCFKGLQDIFSGITKGLKNMALNFLSRRALLKRIYSAT